MSPIWKATSCFACVAALCAFVANSQSSIGNYRQNIRERLQELIADDMILAARQIPSIDGSYSSAFRGANVEGLRNANIERASRIPEVKEELYRIGEQLGVDGDEINEEFMNELLSGVGADEIAQTVVDKIAGEHLTALEAIASQLTRGDLQNVKEAVERFYNNLSKVEDADQADINDVADYVNNVDLSKIGGFIENIDQTQLEGLEEFVNGILERNGSKMKFVLDDTKKLEELSQGYEDLDEGSSILQNLRDGKLIEGLAYTPGPLGGESDSDMTHSASDNASTLISGLRGKLHDVRGNLDGNMIDRLANGESLEEAASNLADGRFIDAEFGDGGLIDDELIKDALRGGVRNNLDGLAEVSDVANTIRDSVLQGVNSGFIDTVAHTAGSIRGKIVDNNGATLKGKLRSGIPENLMNGVTLAA